MMRLSRCMLVVVVLLAGIGSQRGPVLGAQNQPPVFRGGTTVVEVDVVVRDGKRQFVADLKAEDFEVLEDGVRQEVSVFYRVLGPGEQPNVPAAAMPATPLPPPQQVQRVMVFLFDPHHIQPGGFDRVRKAAIEFFRKSFREGDVGGVVVNGKMANNRLTSNREELEAALKNAQPQGSASIVRELREWPQFVDIYEAYRVVRRMARINPGPTMLDDVVARACRQRSEDCRGSGRGAVEAEVESKATQLVANERVAAKQLLDAITALSNGLGKLPGRKTLVLITDGFFVEDSVGDLRVVVGRAARASVRIYALDSRGLNRGSASSEIFSAESTSQPELSAPSLGDMGADGPNSLAVDTGGYVIRNENDFGKAFTEIDRDTSSYYIVGFRQAKPPDGKFRSLTVRVKRPGVTVRARKGYLATAEAPVAPTLTPVAPPATPPAPTAPPGPPISPIAPVGVPATASAAGAGVAPAVPPAGAPMPAEGATTPAARATPRNAEAIEKLGGGAVSPRRSDSALPPDVRTQAAAGWDAYQAGDVEKARELLRGVTTRTEAPPWTHYVLGWSQLALGEAPAAAGSWEKVRTAVPEFEPVYFDLADAYQRHGEYNKALDVLREAQRRWPKDVEVYSALGVIQLARGAMNDAIETFTKAVALDPKDANASYNLAKTYEVRFVRSERMRKVGPGSTAGSAALDDKMQAIAYYQRVVALGGPLAEQAKEGLKRLGQ